MYDVNKYNWNWSNLKIKMNKGNILLKYSDSDTVTFWYESN